MKKLILLLLAMLLCVPGALADEPITLDFEDGSVAPFVQSGSCSLTVTDAVAHGGSYALKVSGRNESRNWDAADLDLAALSIPANAEVTVSAWVYVDSDASDTFCLAKNVSGWDWYGSAKIPGKTWTKLTAKFSLSGDFDLRFQNAEGVWNGADYYIDDVTVEFTGAAAAQAPAAPVETAEDEGPAFEYASDFSNGTDGWYARSAGGAAISVTDEKALFINGRTSTWNSPGRDFPLVAGKTYNLSVQVKQDQHDSTNFILSIAHKSGENESYENLGTCTAKKGEWTTIQATYIAGPWDTYVLYVEGGFAETEFAIKDFTCMEKITSFGQPGIPSLKEVYADKFDFGSAVVFSEVMDTKRMDFYASQFGIFTPGNEMKPDSLLDMIEARRQVRATDDQTIVCTKFDSAIPLLEWAKANNMKVHGHVLVWHSQTPDAFFHEDYNTHKPLLSREVMLVRMESYIKQVLTWTHENYPGVIVSWDVVNEAVADGESGAVPGNVQRLRKSLWTDVVGEDFVNIAFQYARKYAAEGVQLYYNDYNTDMTWKRIGILKLVDSLLADGTLDGYGFQSHYTVDTSLVWIDAAFQNMLAREGLKIRVSELDVGIGSLNDINLRRQAEYYGKLFEMYEKYADRIEAVHVWGTVDDLSWRANTYPLLFDSKAQPKYAFWQLTDPTQIPAK